MYSSIQEYSTTMDFVTTNKDMWKQVFLKDEHHQKRKDNGVTYCSFSSNRNDKNSLSVCFKFDNQQQMESHSNNVKKLLEENKEKWSELGDLNSIIFNHWKIICECSNDMRVDAIDNTDDVFWVAKHSVGDKEKWVNFIRSQQDTDVNSDVRWWCLMENVNNSSEFSCVYRLSRDKLQNFVLNFVESLSSFKEMTSVDVNSCQVKFLNVEWENLYNMPISFRKDKDESKLKSIIEELTSLEGGRHHMHKNCIFIRPTGNPLNMQQWDEMMNSDDVKMTYSKLLTINKLDIVGDMAYACYTSHTKFNFKGTENDDIAVFTGVFKKLDGVWKMTFGQRSTGRKPEEDLPKF